jgi:hypothetical protein
MRQLCLFLITLAIAVFSPDSLVGQNEKSKKSDPNVPIFEIKNDAGQTVFAVYPGGVHIFIDDSQKKATGKGFKVSRASTLKAEDTDETYLSVSPESTRVFVKESSQLGFAVGKLSAEVGSENFLNLTQDNYFIGHDVATNISTGLRNSILGYNAGFSLTTGSDNIFIGNKAGYSTVGNENVFIGNEAGYSATSMVRNIFIGHWAGHENVTGQYNTYLGSYAGQHATTNYNTILGGLAGSSNNFGGGNVAVGYVAGRDMVSSNNVYIGMGAGYNNSGTEGGNVFVGYYAGETLSSQDNRLAISNRNPTTPLIYGEFDNRRVAINGTTTNGNTFYVNGSASGSQPWGNTSDMRLKTDILAIPSSLEKVLSLRGVIYSWKDPKAFDSKKHIGFLAQEVEKVVPEVVVNNNDNYSMQYAPLTALLVEAVKEQQKQIQNLEAQNTILQKRLNEVEQLKIEIEQLKKLTKELSEKRE